MTHNIEEAPLGIWTCKIGEAGVMQQQGLDFPMRQRIRQAFIEVAGKEPDFIFSGWRGELTEYERAVVEDREPDDDKMPVKIDRQKLAMLERAADFLDCLEACGVDNWEGYSDACRMADGEDIDL